jgi:hypothetical protein
MHRNDGGPWAATDPAAEWWMGPTGAFPAIGTPGAASDTPGSADGAAAVGPIGFELPDEPTGPATAPKAEAAERRSPARTATPAKAAKPAKTDPVTARSTRITRAAADKTSPDKTPAEKTPAEKTPVGTTPDTPTPDKATPDKATPDKATLDKATAKATRRTRRTADPVLPPAYGGSDADTARPSGARDVADHPITPSRGTASETSASTVPGPDAAEQSTGPDTSIETEADADAVEDTYETDVRAAINRTPAPAPPLPGTPTELDLYDEPTDDVRGGTPTEPHSAATGRDTAAESADDRPDDDDDRPGASDVMVLPEHPRDRPTVALPRGTVPGQSQRKDPLAGSTPPGGPSPDGQSAGGPLAGGPLAGGPLAGGPLAGGPLGGETAGRDTAGRDTAGRDTERIDTTRLGRIARARKERARISGVGAGAGPGAAEAGTGTAAGAGTRAAGGGGAGSGAGATAGAGAAAWAGADRNSTDVVLGDGIRADLTGPDRTRATEPVRVGQGRPDEARLQAIEQSTFWLTGNEAFRDGVAPDADTPPRPASRIGVARPGLPRRPRSPLTGLVALLLAAFAAAFFAWVSAEPFWLAVGHGRTGTATITACSGTGFQQRCAGTFAIGSPPADPAVASGAAHWAAGAYRSGSVALLGVEAADRQPGTTVAARMVRPDSRQAFVGAAGTMLHLRWTIGVLLVLLCGLVIAGATGARRLESPRARRRAVLLSMTGPVALLAGFLAATW